MYYLQRSPTLSLVLCVLMAVPLPGYAFTTGQASQQKGSEYFASNPRGRLLIPVQVWGDVALTGLHYLPDDTRLIELLSLVGGPKGSLIDSSLVIRRGGKDVWKMEFSGQDLFDETAAADIQLMAGDIVYLSSVSKEEEIMETLSYVAAFTGLVSTAIATYFLFEGSR